MQSIANLIHDDPFLKMPKEERIALRKQRRDKLRLSDFRPVENRPVTFCIPNTPYGVRKIAPWKPKKLPEAAPQYRMWFEDLVRASEAEIIQPAAPIIEDIQRAVAFHFGVSRAALVSESKTKDLVWPRHVAMYLCNLLTNRSLPDIGRRFGGRDHTTALYAVHKIRKRVVSDLELAADVAAIKLALGAWG
jgi:hypothetical protein